MTREQILHEALEEIANPIAVMQRRAAAEGKRLDGMGCVALSRDPGYLSTLAQDALDKVRKLPACLTVDELQRESYETACAKGWHDEDGKMLSGAIIHIAKQAVGVLEVSATVEGIRAGKAPIYSHSEHILERLDALPPELLRAVAWMVLVVTEVGESIEDILNEHMTTDANMAGKPTGLGSELADIIIRVCDTAGALGLDMEAELRSKLDYNRTRSHKHGGKLA